MTSETLMTEAVTYTDGDIEMTGYLVWDDAIEGERPGVLVVHEWWGQTDFARGRAEALAELGYTAMAVDFYGDGETADNPERAGELMNALLGDLDALEARCDAALDALKAHETVDAERTGAIGYCMGGAIVLHMARIGADVDVVASFHGDLSLAVGEGPDAIDCRIAVYNGEQDQFISDDSIEAFNEEMERIDAEYHFIDMPGAVHGFANPAATANGEKYGLPLAYNEAADQASWAHMRLLFADTFFG